MSNLLNLTVMSSTPSEDKKGFITKLQAKIDKSVDTAFGKKTSTEQVTYYMKLDSQQKVGFAADLDLSLFRVVERPFVLPEDAENAGETVMLKWLHIK